MTHRYTSRLGCLFISWYKHFPPFRDLPGVRNVLGLSLQYNPSIGKSLLCDCAVVNVTYVLSGNSRVSRSWVSEVKKVSLIAFYEKCLLGNVCSRLDALSLVQKLMGAYFSQRLKNISIRLVPPWSGVPNLPGGRLNKKDGLTRYGDSHVKDKTS